MTPRQALRAETAADHRRVDDLFSALDLRRSGDYRRFLQAQAAAFLPVEQALTQAGADTILPDWRERRRGTLLTADLRDLGAEARAPLAPPALVGEAAMLGALYVLEGSRLGGQLLKRAVPVGLPRRFLDAPQTPGAWRKLLALLDEKLYAPGMIEQAVTAARDVFGLFERAGRQCLESHQR